VSKKDKQKREQKPFEVAISSSFGRTLFSIKDRYKNETYLNQFTEDKEKATHVCYLLNQEKQQSNAWFKKHCF